MHSVSSLNASAGFAAADRRGHFTGTRKKAIATVKRLVVGVAVLFAPSLATYACTSSSLTVAPTPPTFTGPADNFPVGQQIGSWGSEVGAQYMFDSRTWLQGGPGACNGNSYINKAYAEPLAVAIPGLTYVSPANGKSYPVYPTGVPGIGYIVGVRDYGAGLSAEIPLNGRIQTYPYAGGPTAGVTSIGLRARVLFITTGRIEKGSHIIAARDLARLWVTNNDNLAVPAPAYLRMGQVTMTSNVLGCTVTPSTQNQVVNMPLADFTSVGGESAAAGFSVTLQCDSGVNVHATMSDANHSGNVSNVLLPAPGSQVQGLGIRIERENGVPGEYVHFGPDSSIKGNLNQWFVCNSASGGACDFQAGAYDLNFKASYKLLDEGDGVRLTPGLFEAAATLTFSYQ